jgi:hypothetical protein
MGAAELVAGILLRAVCLLLGHLASRGYSSCRAAAWT